MFLDFITQIYVLGSISLTREYKVFKITEDVILSHHLQTAVTKKKK